MNVATSSGTRLHWLDSALSRMETCETPFPHSQIDDVLDEAAALELLCWLEQYTSWQLKQGDWHAYESTGTMPPQRLRSAGMGWIVAPETIEIISEHLGRIFQKKMRPGAFQVEAHRMSAGQWIGRHNDTPTEGRRTHRFVITLGRTGVRGGELVLLGNENANLPLPISSRHNSAIAMEFSPMSYHRVEPVEEGFRYSLVFSFWKQEP